MLLSGSPPHNLPLPVTLNRFAEAYQQYTLHILIIPFNKDITPIKKSKNLCFTN
ncbi:expressed protein [Arabidopsis lyrata subsp. lyrata]|uniref:Expressed protein n=1 Tax=Arabidopsis lyrata subsp. lyrata TaxID=81972 RepID=D7LE12_ARALL|nr:expressed protein [Arabidopsis lyrata subsp. lyrata]